MIGYELSNYYYKAKDELSEWFQPSRQIVFKAGDFDCFMANIGTALLSEYSLADTQNCPETYSNICLDLEVEFPLLNGESYLHRMNVLLLSPAGDTWWTHCSMITRIWDYDPPATVGVDMQSGDIYFISLSQFDQPIVFNACGKLTETQLETVLSELDMKYPYAIKLDDKAMFDFIGQEIGCMELRKNVYVEFKTSYRMRIDCSYTPPAFMLELKRMYL